MFLTLQTTDLIGKIVDLGLYAEQEEIVSEVISELQKIAFKQGFLEGVAARGEKREPLEWWSANLEKETEPFMGQFAHEEEDNAV